MNENETLKTELDSVTESLFASLETYKPVHQNYILVGLRDMLYNMRLHDIEQCEVYIANAQHKVNELKKANNEIGKPEL